MIITCPSCSSRYQLADAKVKAAGTKVRCPRCSHKFTVYPVKKEDEPGNATEFFVRKSGVLEEPKPSEAAQRSVPPAAEASSPPKLDLEDPFDQPTRAFNPDDIASLSRDKSEASTVEEPASTSPQVSRESEEETEAAPERPPIRDPAKITPAAYPVEETPPPVEARPFGDQTLFEIQKAGRKSRFKLGRVAAGGLVIVAAAYGIQSWLSSSGSEDSMRQQAMWSIERPSNWYRDEPEVYREIQISMAALPQKERAKPENLLLLSEALVLNGLLSGRQEELTQGLGYAGPLILNGIPIGVMANSAWAIWEEKLDLQRNLLETWPESLRQEPEYQLLQMMTWAQSRQISDALETGKALIEAHPEFQRASNYLYLLALSHEKEARTILPENFIATLRDRYLAHRTRIQNQLRSLPKLHQKIDALSGIQSVAEEPKKKIDEPVKPKEDPDSEEQPPLKIKEPAPNPFAEMQNEPRRSRSGLPLASQDLVAQNSANENNRTKALRLLNQGNDKLQAGEDAAALELYREAIRSDSSLPEVYKRIGMLYMRQKENQKARTAFQLYLRLNPSSSEKQIVEGWISSLE